MTSPTGAVEAVGGIFEAEVGLTILMPDTMISAMVSGGSGGMVLASVNFTSGSPDERRIEMTTEPRNSGFTSGSLDECMMDMPPPRCNSGITPTQHRACLAITTLFLFYTTLLLL
ncbi:uncharacterized protein LOC115925068 [Strongylocentrotus purpuratus]|uniref:Uncharacterized protein n=1 Tax=Strongylocentrotus purpuratus TaxID=7668 RepID=A0A7M7NZK3_STRPU|nr:uncharacterized protein LOC115925068 [Strongylocentrotus purpuratus]